jgi:hypothetical protein
MFLNTCGFEVFSCKNGVLTTVFGLCFLFFPLDFSASDSLETPQSKKKDLDHLKDEMAPPEKDINQDSLDMLDGLLDDPEKDQGAQARKQMADQIDLLRKKLEGVEKMFQEGETRFSQKPQKEVVETLSKWIEELRPRMQKSESEQNSQSQSSGEGEGGPGSGNTPGDSDQTPQKPSDQGAKDSTFRKGSNRIGELRKFVDQKATSSWGKLPKKDREALVQKMKEKLPKGNARWIEEFSRRMASGEAK